jgi:hypothetical protein
MEFHGVDHSEVQNYSATAFGKTTLTPIWAHRDFRSAFAQFYEIRVYDDMIFALFEENDLEA